MKKSGRKTGEQSRRRQLVLFSERPRQEGHLPRKRVPHEIRPEVQGAIHVVWRIRRGLPRLRTPRGLRRLEGAFRKGKERDGFALVQYSIQEDHLHLIVEVEDRRKLSRGLQALGIRLAKSLNSFWHRKRGNVFAERYFAAAAKSVRQMWRTIRYVINNGRKHGSWRIEGRPDPYSSGPWFGYWRERSIRRPHRSSPVMESRMLVGFFPWVELEEVLGPRWHEITGDDLLLRVIT